MTDNSNELTKQVMLAASHMGARLFRRNVGMGWIGRSTTITKTQVVTLRPGDVVVHQARPFHNGTPGQSDTWGWRPVTVTADMVGQVIAQHVEVEIKAGKDRESPEQKSWREAVNKAGGRAGIVRGLGDLDWILG